MCRWTCAVAVALMFNIGAGYEPAYGILDTLGAYGVPGSMFVMGWLAAYGRFNDHVWYSDWVESHRWIFPAICLPGT